MKLTGRLHVVKTCTSVIVLLVCACLPASANVKFVDVTEAAGIRFRHITGATGERYMPETMGSGCAFLDYDTDGNLDILLLNGRDWHAPDATHTSRLYRNLGNGKFSDVTEAAKLNVPMYSMGVTSADYDNDGDADIYLTAVGKNRMFRNNGDGTFTDATDFANVGDAGWGTSAAFFDADRDGWLDLFVCNYVTWTPETDIPCTVAQHRSYCTPTVYAGQSCRFYRNRGDGTFEDATLQAGLHNPNGKSLGVTVLDYDDDGWPDLAVANDTEPNFLYRNNGDGTFTDEAIVMGVAFSASGKARGSMGIDAADAHNTGGTAIAIGNFSNEKTAFFSAEPSAAYFTDTADRVNIGDASRRVLTFGLLFFDCDFDGYLDLFFVNGHIEPEVGRYQQHTPYAQLPALFQNRGDGTFRDIGTRAGLQTPSVGRGCAYGDYDNDGDLDLLVSNNGVDAAYATPWLLCNESESIGNYLRVKLVGTKSNRDGIGAKVQLKAGNIVQQRMARTGSSYCSQSELTLTFGLGQNDTIASLEVTWPSGQTDRRVALKANQCITVIEREFQP